MSFSSAQTPKQIAVVCPSCGGETKSRGQICDANWFAGRQLKHILPGGELFACLCCDLNFRWPSLPKAELDSLYESGYEIEKESNWIYEPEKRLDWQIAKSIFERMHVNRTVLDIGCFDGGFLRYLGHGWDLYGVEINEGAALRASLSNVNVLAKDYSCIPEITRRFGVVTAMNVIEHVRNPLAFLRNMADLALPGGTVMISSGSTSAWSWRFMGSNYWYCHLAGHISFISPKWCVKAARDLGLEILEIIPFAHHPANFIRKSREALANIFSALAPWSLRYARRIGMGGVDVEKFPTLAGTPLGWMTAKDHIAVIFRRPFDLQQN